MARNLRRKIPEQDTLYVYDVNSAAAAKFKKDSRSANEAERSVVVADGPRAVAESAVS